MRSQSRLFFALFCLIALPACGGGGRAILSLNVFDEQQGQWPKNFRATRLEKIRNWVAKDPSIRAVFLQEAREDDVLNGRNNQLPFRTFTPESEGADGKMYGYLALTQLKPERVWEEGFEFPGGLARKTQALVFRPWSEKRECLGVLSVHLSYQSSQVRVQEAEWIANFIKKRANLCPEWLIVGDFNATKESKEFRLITTQAGFIDLVREKISTVGPYNPVRAIYGQEKPNEAIDGALSYQVIGASARVVLRDPIEGVWVSDHAGILIRID
jgi:endonuclease/exonuclease/phosphatase family metal-dependent hydrolase